MTIDSDVPEAESYSIWPTIWSATRGEPDTPSFPVPLSIFTTPIEPSALRADMVILFSPFDCGITQLVLEPVVTVYAEPGKSSLASTSFIIAVSVTVIDSLPAASV